MILFFKQSPFDVSNFSLNGQEKNWEGKELEFKDRAEYLEKEFQPINQYCVVYLNLINLLGRGGYGTVSF